MDLSDLVGQRVRISEKTGRVELLSGGSPYVPLIGHLPGKIRLSETKYYREGQDIVTSSRKTIYVDGGPSPDERRYSPAHTCASKETLHIGTIYPDGILVWETGYLDRYVEWLTLNLHIQELESRLSAEGYTLATVKKGYLVTRGWVAVENPTLSNQGHYEMKEIVPTLDALDGLVDRLCEEERRRDCI